MSMGRVSRFDRDGEKSISSDNSLDIGERELLMIGNGVDSHIHDNREPRKGGLESVCGGVRGS